MIETPDSINNHISETHAGEVAKLEAVVNSTLQTAARTGRKIVVIDISHVREEVVAEVLSKINEAGWKTEFKPDSREIRINR